jgi:hypothetical protein
VAGALAFGAVPAASAQQNFIPGLAGIEDGTQAAPGVYAAVVGWGYTAGTLFTANGQSVRISSSYSSYFISASVSMVTKLQLLGANYGFSVSVPWTSGRLDVPRVNVNTGGGWGLTSIYLQPVSLGWHRKQADFLVGYAVYFPTGSWTFNGSNNSGLGMYTQEINVGTTVYLNRQKSAHFAAELVYDINSLKRDTTYRQSDPLTLQGGLGVNYGKTSQRFSGWFGVAAFGQWTIHPTTYGVNLATISGTLIGPYPKNYGVGPEFVTLEGAITLRYLWELGTRSAYQGGLWFVQFAAPL